MTFVKPDVGKEIRKLAEDATAIEESFKSVSVGLARQDSEARNEWHEIHQVLPSFSSSSSFSKVSCVGIY